MIKKFLPIISAVGVAMLITGCSNNITTVGAENTNLNNVITQNKAIATNYKANKKNVLNKYNLEIDTPTTLELTKDNVVEENEEDIIRTTENTEQEETNQQEIEKNTEIKENTENKEDLETFYTLSKDVNNECDDFCELKEDISKAILETENLISKIENNEITLTREQRLYINEQCMQLKSLGKKLANTATELSFNLSDLKQILNENNADVNQLSLKYLIVLDNLVNSNEMLQSGLTTLNLMNNMLNNNNQITFGYKKNNEEPVIKNYTLDEKGELVENTTDSNTTESNNTDSYIKNNPKTNIDTYYSNNQRNNIDTFFNTALFNNELMYGNGGYGFNPYMNQYYNYSNQKTNQNHNNQIDENTNVGIDEDGEKIGNKEKKFKLKKNIDTYRDANTPSLKARITNFKDKISGVLGNINPKENLKNPIYRF